MSSREFLPNSKYQFKLMLVITLIGFLVLLGMGILSTLISLDDPGAGLVVFGITILGVAIYWVVGMLISVPYFRSLRYEIQDDEVIVNVGIITHSVKHVPYRHLVPGSYGPAGLGGNSPIVAPAGIWTVRGPNPADEPQADR